MGVNEGRLAARSGSSCSNARGRPWALDRERFHTRSLEWAYSVHYATSTRLGSLLGLGDNVATA